MLNFEEKEWRISEKKNCLPGLLAFFLADNPLKAFD